MHNWGQLALRRLLAAEVFPSTFRATSVHTYTSSINALHERFKLEML